MATSYHNNELAPFLWCLRAAATAPNVVPVSQASEQAIAIIAILWRRCSGPPRPGAGPMQPAVVCLRPALVMPYRCDHSRSCLTSQLIGGRQVSSQGPPGVGCAKGWS